MESLTTKDVLARLKQRCGQEYAVLTEVGNATGARQTRYADALGMCLWPSRGLELHGYEIKVSRADWLKELKSPAKADAIAKYCDRWWIVAGVKGIVIPSEMPQPWGLIEPTGDGLRVVKQAEQLPATPVDRAFLAAIFRRAVEQSADVESLKAAEKAGRDAGYKNGFAAGKAQASRDHKGDDELRKADDELRKAVDEFERASGVRIEAYAGQHYGKEFQAFLLKEHTIPQRMLTKLQNVLDDLSASVEKLKQSPLLEKSEQAAESPAG